MRALECLQSLLDFQHYTCFLTIQSQIARLTTLYGRLITGSGPVNGVSAPFASSSALSLLKMPSCPGTHEGTDTCPVLLRRPLDYWGASLITFLLHFVNQFFQITTVPCHVELS